MIYVCEYDGSIDDSILQNLVLHLPVTLPEGWQWGRKWKKARQRILAWLLLDYGLSAKDAEEEVILADQMRPADADASLIEETAPGAALKRLVIDREEHGKPYSKAFPDLYFNISHSDTACACIIAEAPAGIDVERKFLHKENLEWRGVYFLIPAQFLKRLLFLKAMILTYMRNATELIFT